MGCSNSRSNKANEIAIRPKAIENEKSLQERNSSKDPEPKPNRSTTLISSTRQFKTPIPIPSPYKSNKISTSKYNCLTFLPKKLVPIKLFFK